MSRALPPGATVLVAEDEPAVRRALCGRLRLEGCDVIESGDGADALELVLGDAERRLKLLVADVVLPLMDGLTLARAARRARPDLRVLLISGDPATVARLAGGAEPGLPFLPKPFTPAQFIREARRLLAAEPPSAADR